MDSPLSVLFSSPAQAVAVRTEGGFSLALLSLLIAIVVSSAIAGYLKLRWRPAVILCSVALRTAVFDVSPVELVQWLVVAHQFHSMDAEMAMLRAPPPPPVVPPAGLESTNTPPRRRSPSPRASRPTTPPEKLATPVLQMKLREVLGHTYALPRGKASLVALYRQHLGND
jgi:hypothetical protein|eukprot:3304121-Prymnesium_polylepis.1